jgi:hypothetical protein
MILGMTKGSDAVSVATTSTPAGGRAQKASVAAKNGGHSRMGNPATCEREYTAAELELMSAIQDYKVSSGRLFPTWSEVLEVVRELGYQKSEVMPGGVR